MASGVPSLVRRRRNCAPQYLSLSRKLLAAIFDAILMGLLVGSRPLPMTLAPLMRLSGHSRSQETKWCSVSHLLGLPGSHMWWQEGVDSVVRCANATTLTPWSAAWLWSVPLLIVTVVIDAFGLGMIDRRVYIMGESWLIMPVMASCAAILHGSEGTIWAAAHVLLGALPDRNMIRACTLLAAVRIQRP